MTEANILKTAAVRLDRIFRRPDMPGILIVEDEIMLAKDLARSLKNFGYEIARRVVSAEEPNRIEEDSKLDRFLMDMNLQGGADGIQTAEKIRRRFDTPVVYLNGLKDREPVE